MTRSRSGSRSTSAKAKVLVEVDAQQGVILRGPLRLRFVGAEVGLRDRRRLINVPPAQGEDAHEQSGDKQPDEKGNGNHSGYLAATDR